MAQNQQMNSDTERLIGSLLDKFIRQEETERSSRLAIWKRNEFYWRAFQYLIWDDVARDFRLPPSREVEDLPKAANIYKAHGESIIAALTQALPVTRFFPEDADNPEDVETARTWSHAAEVVQNHNDARLLAVRALYTLYNQDFVAAYNYNKADEKYGTVQIPLTEDKEITRQKGFCANCGAELDAGNGLEAMDACPECGSTDEPVFEDVKSTLPVVKKITTEPKTRECIEIYGPTHVKVNMSARTQEDTGYLLFSCEKNFAYLKHVLPKLRDQIGDGTPAHSEDRDVRQRFTNYDVDYLVTTHFLWIRPWQFEALGETYRKEIDQFKKDYPDGVRAILVEKSRGSYLLGDLINEGLDERWTISVSATSESLHDEPRGNDTIPMQDMTNSMVNLTLDTIEFGIPMTFATPQVLDFEQFKENEARPGDIYPTEEVASGQALGQSFHTVSTASLSREVEAFADRLDKLTQFISGDVSPIHGGPGEGGGTLGEYELSRNQALQRLSLPWKSLNIWWAKMMEKSVRSYLQNLKTDEKLVKWENNIYTNIWIRKSEAKGSIGNVSAETADYFPMTAAQKRAQLFELMQMNSPELNQVIYAPENAEYMSVAFGYPDINIPGADQRNKQFREIHEMLQAPPVENPMMQQALQTGDPMMAEQAMQNPMVSSVQIEPDIDDDQIHADVCRDFLQKHSDLKTMNPPAYMNILLHFKEHLLRLQAMMAQMQPAPEEQSKETANASN